MTTTTPGRTDRPWPSRRERDGGPDRPAATVVAATRGPVRGRHHAETSRPATRTGAPRPAAPVTAPRPTGAGPSVAAHPVGAASALAPRPVGAAASGARHPVDAAVTERLPIVVRGGHAPVGTALAIPRQRGVPVRPAPVAPPVVRPYPPRPMVGSAVGAAGPAHGHRVDGRVRRPRNGLGLAAVCLALVGLPFGLLPVSGFLATGLGVLAVAFGIAGWSRTRSRTATNPGWAVTGAVLGLVALGLGVVGTVAFLQPPHRAVYDVDALTSTIAAPIGE